MKHSDSLLGDVGRRVREKDGLDDPRWSELAAGELADEEAEALRARSEDGQAHPLAYEAFRALDAGERDAMADALFAGLQRGAAGPAAREALSDEGRVDGAPRSVITPIRRPRRALARALAAAVPLAAAAVIALLLRAGAPSPLPGYSAIVEGSRRELRATSVRGDLEPVRLGAGEHLRVILRPDTEVLGALSLRAFVVGSGSVRALDVEVESKPYGTLFVPEIRADMLGLGAGACEIVFAVGRPEALPSREDLVRRIAEGAAVPPDGAFRLLRVPLVLDARP